jgi:hypothetical protein
MIVCWYGIQAFKQRDRRTHVLGYCSCCICICCICCSSHLLVAWYYCGRLHASQWMPHVACRMRCKRVYVYKCISAKASLLVCGSYFIYLWSATYLLLLLLLLLTCCLLLSYFTACTAFCRSASSTKQPLIHSPQLPKSRV